MKSLLVKAYDVHYKKLFIFSLLILFLSIGSVGYKFAMTGELFHAGVSLKGGITLTAPISEAVDVSALESSIKSSYPASDVVAREITTNNIPSSIIVEASDISQADLISAISDFGIPLNPDTYSIESVGSALGSQFLRQMLVALLLAFVAMAIVVLITFRSLIPSSFVVLAAFSDIVSTLAVVNLLDMRLGTAGIAAFLMLIGFSVDTDILLTTKVLKRKGEGGSIFERTVEALKTGVTMSSCALVAAVIGAIFTNSEVMRQIMIIVAIGTAFDLLYTWFQNAGILRLFLERKEKQNVKA